VREPLLHFLLGGAALFGLHAWLDPGDEPQNERIVVTADQIGVLATAFERTWLQPPNGEELASLIDDFLTEEILYREALKLGLDQNDLVVRRRMRQKMEFLHEDLRDAPEPTDAELARVVAENRNEFRVADRMSFRQLFVDPERAGSEARGRALHLLERLRSEPSAHADGPGDPTLLPSQLDGVTRADIDRLFGEGFAHAVADLRVGTWVGPIASEFGLHVVLVTERRPAYMPELREIRSRVERKWEAERRQEAAARFRRTLRERYEIEVELPSPVDGTALASRAR
jgi:hypothetical protein